MKELTTLAALCSLVLTGCSDIANPDPSTNLSFKSLVVGGETACGIASDDYAYCWGENQFTIIPRFPLVAGPQSTPLRIEQLGQAKDVALAGDGTLACAALLDANISCWGFFTRKTSDFPARVDGISQVSQIAVGSAGSGAEFQCSVRADGSVACWGYDGSESVDGGTASGQLGTGTVAQGSVYPPAPIVGGLTFSRVALGSRHACGLDLSGAAYCWGANRSGQLGTTAGVETCSTKTGSRTLDTWACSSKPIRVDGGLTFRTLAAAGLTTCGITSANAGYCWGGALGSQPSPVLAGQPLRSISVSQNGRYCAATTAGHVVCVGANDFGQGGDANTASGLHTLTSDIAFVSVQTSDAFTCGLTADGIGYCWGSSAKSELGTTEPLSTCGAAQTPCSAIPRRVALAPVQPQKL